MLQHINKLSTKYIWLRIDTKPARKIMKDGRNAHLIIENEDWWRERLQFALQMKITRMYTNKKQRIDVELMHG